jgi:AcrR family transcriptional regulator
MGIADRKVRARDELRGRILKTAEKLFVAKGYENVSMRMIAREIEYSATTIYHHFKSKGELFGCLLETYQAMLNERMEEIYRRAGLDPVAAVRQGMRMYAEFGLANPSYYKLAFNSPPEFKAEAYLNAGSKGTDLFLGLRTRVEACIRQGRFREMDPDLAAQVVWMMNHGVTSLLLSNPNFPWKGREALIDSVIDCTIEGLLASKGDR